MKVNALRRRQPLDRDNARCIGGHVEQPPRTMGRHGHMVFLIGGSGQGIDRGRGRPLLVLRCEGRGSNMCEHEAGILLGVGGWTRRGPLGENDPRTVHIRHFATHPDAVRQGVAGAIMEVCLAQIASTEAERISCAATRTAVPFYRSFDFDILEDVDLELRPGITFPAILMERLLV